MVLLMKHSAKNPLRRTSDVSIHSSTLNGKMMYGQGFSRQSLALTAAGLFLLLSAGCGPREDEWTRQRPKVYKASGVVLQDGKPVTDAVVTFRPEEGEFSGTGYTNPEGRFQLKTFRDNDGVTAEKFKVTVAKIEWVPIGGTVANDPVPGGGSGTVPLKRVLHTAEKYSEHETTELTATVTPDGPNEFTFELDPPEK